MTITDQPVWFPAPPDGAAPVAVVWDVDGTLVLGDTLLPFLRRFVGATRLTAVVLAAAARYAGTPDRRGTAKTAVLRETLRGREVADVDEVARAYVADLVMQRLRPDCLRRWQWHRAQGHRLVLASASLDIYLRQLGMLLGASAVISTEMAVAGDVLTGLPSTPNCRGAEKAARVRRYLDAHPARPVWVYANGAADRPLLELADVPVRVRPYRVLHPAAGTGATR
jgi:phosphatidylglycerophosphatase C